MEYQPFDFDKLDALLRECEALSGDSPPPDRESSGRARAPHPIDDGFGDPDPFSGWPTLEPDTPGRQFAGSACRAGSSGGAPIA